MSRTPIKYDVVMISDLVDTWGAPHQGRILVNIRGTNGSGKSTIPISMLDDPNVFLTSWVYSGKEKPFATVFPNYNCVALGTYMNKTGGLDTFSSNDMTVAALNLFWASPYNIIMEGVISSTIKSTYKDLFLNLGSTYKEFDRTVVVVSLVTPVGICINRVFERNGGKDVNNALIEGKWKTVYRNVGYFSENGLNSIALDNSDVEKEDTLCWFDKELKKHVGKGLLS